MVRSLALTTALTCFFFLAGIPQQQAEKVHHFVLERTGFLSGNYGPPKKLEMWITVDKLRMHDGKGVGILRLDSGKLWKFKSGDSKYTESPLAEALNFGTSLASQEEYNWKFSKDASDTIRNGLRLRRCRVLGVAAHSEMQGTIWFAPDIPARGARFSNAFVRPFWLTSGNLWTSLAQSDSVFGSCVIAEVQWSAVGQGDARDTYRLVGYEAVAPPEGWFEPPKNGTLLLEERK